VTLVPAGKLAARRDKGLRDWPAGEDLADSDGEEGAYALTMGSIAAVLAGSGQRQAQGLVPEFLEPFAGIREAPVIQGLLDEADGRYYDRLLTPRPGRLSWCEQAAASQPALHIIDEPEPDRAFAQAAMVAPEAGELRQDAISYLWIPGIWCAVTSGFNLGP
jgi:hypothetical protein